VRHRSNQKPPRQCRSNGARAQPTSCLRSPAAGRSWRSPPRSQSRHPSWGRSWRSPPRSQSRHPSRRPALLPLGLYPLWWIARPRRVLRAVRTKHAGRVAAAQPHPPAPQKQTGLEESATSLFVLPIDKRQHVSIASLDDPPGAAPSFLRREAESRRHARPGTPRERRRAPRRRDLCFSGMSETS